jgi:tetratricopeptide (TPR) repeat protein
MRCTFLYILRFWGRAGGFVSAPNFENILKITLYLTSQGNLGWALMQKENYTEAEVAYRQALLIGPDNNKMCNLGICLMQQGRVAEAKEVLMQVRPPSISHPLRSDPLRGCDSHLKAFERAQEMLRDLETRNAANWRFDTFLGQSSATIWQPHPCTDYVAPLPVSVKSVETFANENCKLDPKRLNVDAAPFFSSKMVKKCLNFGSENIPLCNLKRTRSVKDLQVDADILIKRVERRRSIENRYPELPNDEEFDAALVAAVLGPLLEEDETTIKDGKTGTRESCVSSTQSSPAMPEGKKLRIFQDITASLNRE